MNFSLEESIIWEMILPNSPHFCGLWQSGVQSVKHHLRRVIGNNNLVYEEIFTVLVHIGSTLNFRPLTQLTSDPDSLDPLTPAPEE